MKFVTQAIPTKMKLSSYSLEDIVKNRSRLLEEYNNQGFKRLEKVLKKSKNGKKIKSMNVDQIYEFMMESFENIFDALFFSFYFLTNIQKHSDILQKRNSSFVLSQIFKGMLDFINFDEMFSLNLISVQDEVRNRSHFFRSLLWISVMVMRIWNIHFLYRFCGIELRIKIWLNLKFMKVG